MVGKPRLHYLLAFPALVPLEESAEAGLAVSRRVAFDTDVADDSCADRGRIFRGAVLQRAPPDASLNLVLRRDVFPASIALRTRKNSEFHRTFKKHGSKNTATREKKVFF